MSNKPESSSNNSQVSLNPEETNEISPDEHDTTDFDSESSESYCGMDYSNSIIGSSLSDITGSELDSDDSDMPVDHVDHEDRIDSEYESSDVSYCEYTNDSDTEFESDNENSNHPNKGGKNAAKVIWSEFGEMKKFPFIKTQQFLLTSPGNKPIDFFTMFLNDELIKYIVDKTNKYAIAYYSKITDKPRNCNKWTELTVSELKTFIALLIQKGIQKYLPLNKLWTKKSSPSCCSRFNGKINEVRLKQIIRCLHFSDVYASEHEERKTQIEYIINDFYNKMERIYYPGKNLALFQPLVSKRGTLRFRDQLRYSKIRREYPAQLYMLIEPDGLIQKCLVYTDPIVNRRHTDEVVIKIMEGKLNQGHSIYLVEYYANFGLAKELLNKETYCTGVYRLKRKDNPEIIVNAKLYAKQNISRFSDGVHIGIFRDFRHEKIPYISTEFGNEMIPVEGKKGKPTEEPLAVANCGRCMKVLDWINNFSGFYPGIEEKMAWHKKIFIHILQIILFNSHNLFNQYSGSEMKGIDYRMDVINALLDTN